MSHLLKIIGSLAVLLFVIVGGWYAWTYFSQGTGRQYQNQLPETVQPLVQAKRSGNDTTALAQYQKLQTESNTTAEEKALADVYIAGAEYGLTGNTAALLQDVQRMKAIAKDTTLSPKVRAAAMSILGNEYSVSGGNPTVSQEIYKDPPFDAYLVPNEPQLSSVRLEKESYALFPSSYAAIKVAELSLKMYFVHPNQSASTTAEYVAEAEEYLRKADATAYEEVQNSPLTVWGSDRYVMYRFSRALTIGRLAIEKGEPYKSQYKREFENFITFAKSSQSTIAAGEILNARFQYAQILAIEQDTAGEKAQLDLLARAINGLANPNTNPFVLLLKGMHQHQPTGSTWLAVQKMSTVSPDFGTMINMLVASSTK